MGDFTLPLRAALLSLFKTDAVLIPLVGTKWFDYVPQETAFPYGRVGDDAITDYGDKSNPGQQFIESIHVFDRSPKDRGQKVINQIQAQLYALLHEKQLAVSTGQLYLSRFYSQRVLTEDGLMWHGVSQYKFLLS